MHTLIVVFLAIHGGQLVPTTHRVEDFKTVAACDFARDLYRERFKDRVWAYCIQKDEGP